MLTWSLGELCVFRLDGFRARARERHGIFAVTWAALAAPRQSAAELAFRRVSETVVVVDSLNVLPAYQRQGLLSALVDRLPAFFARHGVRLVYCAASGPIVAILLQRGFVWTARADYNLVFCVSPLCLRALKE